MASEDLAKQLHDRATRGELLSAEEQALLENWYALQDSMESEILGLTGDEKTLATVKAQIEVVLARLIVLTKRIQEVTAENENLGQEIIMLRRQLAGSSTAKQAA